MLIPPDFDFENFIVTVPVMLIIVFGVVEYLKAFKIEGNALRLASLGVGLLLATVYKLRELYPAALPWIDIGFFGLAVGLTASGIYDYLKKNNTY